VAHHSGGRIVRRSLLLFGALSARWVSEHWLQHSIRSFAKFYVIFWSRKVMDRSPLHMLGFAIAFIPLRLLAAANNLLIYLFGTGPLGRLIGLLTHYQFPCFKSTLHIRAVLHLGFVRRRDGCRGSSARGAMETHDVFGRDPVAEGHEFLNHLLAPLGSSGTVGHRQCLA
jgi:hypothetical protein